MGVNWGNDGSIIVEKEKMILCRAVHNLGTGADTGTTHNFGCLEVKQD